MLGHAIELITLDIYGDNQEIIADCVDEFQPFIDEVLPVKEDDEQMKQELLEISIPVEEYLLDEIKNKKRLKWNNYAK